MSSSSVVKILVAIVLAALSSGATLADTLILSDSTVYGRVVAISSKTVVFSAACNTPVEYDASKLRRVEFNSSCNPVAARPYSAGGDICKNPRSLIEVSLRSPTGAYAASRVEIAGGRVHLLSSDETEAVHGPVDRIDTITRRLYCPDNIPSAIGLNDFCSEAVQHAVNFSYEPVFGNKILTRGISFYLEDDVATQIADTELTAQMVRKAFGTAMTEWMSALYARKAALPDEVREPIEKMISRSFGGFTLLTPPQVVQLGCRDTATFVIRFVTRSDEFLRVPGSTRPKAARAQVAGRALIINGFDYKCWKADYKQAVYLDTDLSGAECVNLVPILIHELGHAFGLAGHHDDPERPSVMDSVIRDTQAIPTDADAEELLAILVQPIQGTAPGLMDADGLGIEIAPKK